MLIFFKATWLLFQITTGEKHALPMLAAPALEIFAQFFSFVSLKQEFEAAKAQGQLPFEKDGKLCNRSLWCVFMHLERSGLERSNLSKPSLHS
jgi:hypothetical protein